MLHKEHTVTFKSFSLGKESFHYKESMCLLPSSGDKVLNDPKSLRTFTSFTDISFLKISV